MSEGGADDGQEKSQAPTQRKLEKSREQGDVPYSMEVTNAATYAALLFAVLLLGGKVAVDTGEVLVAFFRRPANIADVLVSDGGTAFIGKLILDVLIAVGPVFAFLMVATSLSLVAQRAVVFAPSKLSLKFSRLSIVDNAKQKFGPNGIGEFVKSVAKMLALTIILLVGFWDRFFELPYLAKLPAQSFGPVMARNAVYFLGLSTGAAILIASLDLPWKRYRHEQKLRMSPEEIKKESKENEGDPTLKGERRRRAQEIATNRMLTDVPDANVVIVNPTHYAVALRWDKSRDAAPRCVAKGVDEIAARIRETAAQAGVPIHRDPPTARSLHALVNLDEEIKREHYAAVAAAIHYAEEIRRKASARGLS